MFDYKCVWSALYPISNHSHIRQLQFATHAFSQQVLQQAVQISICQWHNLDICVLRRLRLRQGQMQGFLGLKVGGGGS